jgi:hypothetical protein
MWLKRALVWERPSGFPSRTVLLGGARLTPVRQHRRLSSRQLTHDQRHQVSPDLMPRCFDGRCVKADKANALSDFNSGTGGFKDRDLYPFCFNIADGATAGAGTVKGKDVKTLKDAAGKRSIGIGARSSGARTAKRSAK